MLLSAVLSTAVVVLLLVCCAACSCLLPPYLEPVEGWRHGVRPAWRGRLVSRAPPVRHPAAGVDVQPVDAGRFCGPHWLSQVHTQG